MASNNYNNVLLGFEDGIINEKYKPQLNFTVNKIGGKPDIPKNIKIETQICPLCQLPRPLIIQIYAPTDNSIYHRTLYIFACINSNCWNRNESWVCIRIQSEEKVEDSDCGASIPSSQKLNVQDWCTGADEWDDDEEDNNISNVQEENGNLINNLGNSDVEDDSTSFEESVKVAFENLTVDECNANNEIDDGAVGRLNPYSAATAEIEGDEGEVVILETPTFPQSNIATLLHDAAPLPEELCNTEFQKNQSIEFVSYFISVSEESQNITNQFDQHVKELLQEYQQKDKDDFNAINIDNGGSSTVIDHEKYEKSYPAHGDSLCHYFISKIQTNPGQILRYNRGSETPLLLHPLQLFPNKCAYCQGDVGFEFQILPTIIPKLKLTSDVKIVTRLEFGTVIIFTCKNSCWSSDTTFRTETIVVQSEII